MIKHQLKESIMPIYKYIFILFLLILNLDAEEQKQKITIGLGPYIQTQPYKDVDNIFIPSPVIFFDNGLIYIRWSRGGIYFLGDKQEDYMWGFSLTAQPRTYGYEKEDIKGMDQRNETIEAGLAFSATYKKSYVEIMLLTDILGKYDSWILKTELGYDLKIGDFSLYPSLIVIYQSSDFMNYYYGVKESEVASSGFNKYVPNDGFLLGAQTYIKYPITENLATLVNIRADKISDEAANSPLVDQNYIYSGMLSLIYTFTY